MNAAVAILVAALSGGAGAIFVALISAVVGRGGRRADIAEKISQAWEPVIENVHIEMGRLSDKCTKCETALDDMRKVLRAVVRAIDTENQAAVDQALAAARDLL